jgi:hypothetical protein
MSMTVAIVRCSGPNQISPKALPCFRHDSATWQTFKRVVLAVIHSAAQRLSPRPRPRGYSLRSMMHAPGSSLDINVQSRPVQTVSERTVTQHSVAMAMLLRSIPCRSFRTKSVCLLKCFSTLRAVGPRGPQLRTAAMPTGLVSPSPVVSAPANPGGARQASGSKSVRTLDYAQVACLLAVLVTQLVLVFRHLVPGLALAGKASAGSLADPSTAASILAGMQPLWLATALSCALASSWLQARDRWATESRVSLACSQPRPCHCGIRRCR